MPSILANGQSGGQLVISGLQWSGYHRVPMDGIQLVWDPLASGNAYVGLSGSYSGTGGVTIHSGTLLDGLPMQPGGAYFVPYAGCQPSGFIGVTFTHDVAASGLAFMAYEVF